MKKKIILALTACLFTAGSIINMHLTQSDHNADITLADISVMAQADGESGGKTNNCGHLIGAWCLEFVNSCDCFWDVEGTNPNCADNIPSNCK